MLVLSRRIGERIVIDNDIILEVLDIRGNRISVGIQAPPGSTILRQELLLPETHDEESLPPVGDYAPVR